MAEDIPLDPFDPDRGEDDRNDEQHETSFGGDDWTRDSERYKLPYSHHENQAYEPDDETPPLINRLEREKDAGEAFFREKFVNPDFRSLVCGLDDNGRYWVKLVRGGAKTHYVNEDLSNLSKLPPTIHQYLGDTKRGTPATERSDCRAEWRDTTTTESVTKSDQRARRAGQRVGKAKQETQQDHN